VDSPLEKAIFHFTPPGFARLLWPFIYGGMVRGSRLLVFTSPLQPLPGPLHHVCVSTQRSSASFQDAPFLHGRTNIFISENPFLYRAAGVYLTGVHSLLAEVPIWPRLRSLRKGLPGIFQRRPLQRGASEWDVHARRATEHGKEATLLFWDPRRASHIQRGRSWLNVRRHVLTDRRGEVKRLRPRRNWVRAEHGQPN